ncbi:MAG: HEAT repeat domain-containing protein [Elusimicrobiota bacterium]
MLFLSKPGSIKSEEKKTSLDLNALRVKHFRNLVDALNSKEANIRSTAIVILGKIDDKSIPGHIKKFLKDNSKSVVMETALSLSKYGDKSGVGELIKILNNKPKEKTLSPVEKTRVMKQNLDRAKAAKYLGEICDRRSIESLKNASADEEGRVKDAALVALIKLGDKSHLEVFYYGLETGFESAMEKSAEVLGELRDKDARERLRELLKKWDKKVKSAAAVALGQIGDNDSAPSIRSLLSDKNPSVRAAAAESLGELRDINSIEALKKTLEDENGFVRLCAAEALMKMEDDSGKYFTEMSLKTGDIDAKLKAAGILAEYGKKGSIQSLEEAFELENNRTMSMEISGTIIRIIDREK